MRKELFFFSHLNNINSALEEFKKEKSNKNFNNLAMECFQTVNYLVSLLEDKIKKEKLGYAVSYADLVNILYLKKMLTEDVKKRLMRIIKLRNLIAHEYYKIKESELEEMAKTLLSLEEDLTSIFR